MYVTVLVFYGYIVHCHLGIGSRLGIILYLDIYVPTPATGGHVANQATFNLQLKGTNDSPTQCIVFYISCIVLYGYIVLGHLGLGLGLGIILYWILDI